MKSIKKQRYIIQKEDAKKKREAKKDLQQGDRIS